MNFKGVQIQIHRRRKLETSKFLKTRTTKGSVLVCLNSSQLKRRVILWKQKFWIFTLAMRHLTGALRVLVCCFFVDLLRSGLRVTTSFLIGWEMARGRLPWITPSFVEHRHGNTCNIIWKLWNSQGGARNNSRGRSGWILSVQAACHVPLVTKRVLDIHGYPWIIMDACLLPKLLIFIWQLRRTRTLCDFCGSRSACSQTSAGHLIIC